jgi:hypothetical protein
VPDAIAVFQRAVASNPRYTDAYFRMGIALDDSPRVYSRGVREYPIDNQAA